MAHKSNGGQQRGFAGAAASGSKADTCILIQVCEAIEFDYLGERMVSTAGAEGSRLPVRLRDGTALLVLWGAQKRRFYDIKRELRIQWPDGPCLPLDQIRSGALAACEPRPVRIIAKRFLVTICKAPGYEVDTWVSLEPGQALQGCYFRQGRERAVYVVTVSPPTDKEVVSAWPRVVGGNRKSDKGTRR